MAILRQSELVESIRSRIEQAIDSNSNSNMQRAKAYQQFFGEPNGTEGEGRSQFQSMDVNGMVTAVAAQMVMAFDSGNMVEFEANSAEDEQSAQAESAAVNKLAIEANGGYMTILGPAQNAMLYRNGISSVSIVDDKMRYTVKHSNVEPADLPFAAESEQGVERRLVSYDRDKKVARVEVTENNKRLKVRTVDNARFFYDPEWNEPSLDGCPLCGEIHYKTRDELIREGCDPAIVKELPATQRYSGTEATELKTLRGRATAGAQAKPIGHAMDVVRVFEVFAYYPAEENDDYAYLWRCWVPESGDAWLKEPEQVDMNTYAVGTCFPLANMSEGESLAEKLYWIQEGKTEIARQWIDNTRNCIWGRPTVIVGQVNADDLNSPGAGKPIRAQRLDAVQWNVIPDVGQSLNMLMEKFDEMRSERGGASLDMIGPELQLANDTAHGTERIYAAKELMVSYMNRNFAETHVKAVFLKAHAMLRAGGIGPINLKIAEQWQPVDPAQWPVRANCNVKVGYAMGERMMMSQVLGSALGNYAQLLQAYEGELVSKAGFYKMTLDYLNLNMIDNPEAYFIDPNSQAALQVSQQKQQAAQASAAKAEDTMKAIEELKASMDQYKVDTETEFKYFDAVLKAQSEEHRAEQETTSAIVQARSDAEVAQAANAGNGAGASSGADKSAAAGRGRGNGKQPPRTNGNGNKAH